MNFTTGKYFLDTNFLIYCFSGDNLDKRNRCREILRLGEAQAVFVLSTQVVKEFASLMIGTFNVDPRRVKQIVADLVDFEIVQVDVGLIQQGIDIHLLYQYSFWDSLIVSAAQAAQCTALLTEDLQHGQVISGVTIFNPFKK